MRINEAKLNLFYYYNVMYVLLDTLGLMTGHKQKLPRVTFDSLNLSLCIICLDVIYVSPKKSHYHAYPVGL